MFFILCFTFSKYVVHFLKTTKFRETKFGRRVQKDAPGPVSPLRVRIFGGWARGASFGPVQKDAPGPVPPFGFEFSEFGFRELCLALFLAFFDFRETSFWR